MIGYRTIAAATFFMAGAVVAMPSEAQITASNPASIAGALRAQGLSVVTKTDTDGDPVLESALGENQKFSVFFYNCTEHRNCQTMQFYAGFSESDADAARLNDWNRSKRFGRAYIDKAGDPAIEMDIDLFGAGMSRELFEDNFQFWRILMGEFSKFIYDTE